MQRVAIFASGNGSNAENIYQHVSHHPEIRITTLVCGNPNAYVLERFRGRSVQSIVITKADMKSKAFSEILDEIDWIVLAGFLWLIPEELIAKFPDRILNIHPSLLPKYGGKGMFGDHVHRAVLENKESESGITIHLVNEIYDLGQIIFQAKTRIEKEETLESLKEKIHALEHEYYPKVIEKYIYGYPREKAL